MRCDHHAMRCPSRAAGCAALVIATLAATPAVGAQPTPGAAPGPAADSAGDVPGSAGAMSASAWRPDQLFIQASHAPTASGGGIGVGWNWPWVRPLGGFGVLAGRTDVILEHWRITRRSDEGGSSATRFGITPVLQWRAARGAGPFLEIGLGINWIAPTYTTAEKRFGSVFNFGEHLGIGWRGAGALPWEWTLRYQHFSNGSLTRPNPGEDFVQLRVAKSF